MAVPEYFSMIKNRQVFSYIIFFLLSAMFLWFPGNANALFCASLISLLIMKYSWSGRIESHEISFFQRLLYVYSLWIIISAAMHYVALLNLDPSSPITASGHSVGWGIGTLKSETLTYILFPLLFIISIYIFQTSSEIYKRLLLIPLIFFPSLLIGLYQRYVDFHFLNPSPPVWWQDRVPGLGTDVNGFGLSLYVIFALCVMGSIIVRKWWNKSAYIILALTVAWCLLLSGSRTGLLGITAFCLTTLCVWICIRNHNRIKRRRFLLIGLLLLLTVFGGITILMIQGGNSSATILQKRLRQNYIDLKKRSFGKIARNRINMGRLAVKATVLAPLSGWGPGGFYRNMNDIEYREKGKSVRIHNANNHYLQISSELGLLGLLLNTLLHIFPLWMIYRARHQINQREEKWAVSLVFSTVAILLILYMTGPHWMSLEVLWLAVLLLAFLFVTAVRYGYSFGRIRSKFYWPWLMILTVMFIWGTYDATLGQNGYRMKQESDWWPYKYERNCYTIEQWPSGKVRWCSKHAFLQIPITNPLPDIIKLAFCAHHPDIELNPLTVKYGGKEGVKHEVILNDHSWKTIEVPTNSDYIFEFTAPNKQIKKYLVVSLDVSRTWIPKEWGIGADERELGLAVLIPSEI